MLSHSAEMLDKHVEEFDVERETLKQFIVNNRNYPYVHVPFF